jgi:hypothetical protein
VSVPATDESRIGLNQYHSIVAVSVELPQRETIPERRFACSMHPSQRPSVLVSRAPPIQTAIRNCTRDKGGPFEFGNQGADLKPPQAAVVKSQGGERTCSILISLMRYWPRKPYSSYWRASPTARSCSSFATGGMRDAPFTIHPTLSEASPMIISESATHVVLAVEIAETTLARHQ